MQDSQRLQHVQQATETASSRLTSTANNLASLTQYEHPALRVGCCFLPALIALIKQTSENKTPHHAGGVFETDRARRSFLLGVQLGSLDRRWNGYTLFVELHAQRVHTVAGILLRKPLTNKHVTQMATAVVTEDLCAETIDI